MLNYRVIFLNKLFNMYITYIYLCLIYLYLLHSVSYVNTPQITVFFLGDYIEVTKYNNIIYNIIIDILYINNIFHYCEYKIYI